MARFLNGLYSGAAWLAGLFTIGTLLAVLASIIGRLTRFDAAGADAYAGYAMAAASFLALPATLRRGEHIRVTLFASRLGPRARHALEVLCHVAGGLLAGALAWYAGRLVWQSYVFNDISTNLDATPLWIPQIGMAVGTFLLLVAILEDLVRLLRGGVSALATEPDERAHIE